MDCRDGGLRQSADGSEWVYGDIDLVTQFIVDGQELKPWLESMGSTFIEDTQPTLIGALWYRENEFIGADVDADGDGICDNHGTNCAYVDANGDGVCDNQGAGYAYVDADGDGVCDNYGSGALRPQDGTGLHRGHCGGRGC